MSSRGGRQGDKDEEDKPDYFYVNNPKSFLDMIGKDVYDKVHKKDADYRNYLQGHLKDATYSKKPDNEETPKDPCELDYQWHTNVTDGYEREYPCKDRPDVRFSDIYEGQCTDSKIKGNEKTINGAGACAPFRRLFLCDQHLSHMKADQIDNTHKLLVEVCLAAKYEGQTITLNYPKYQAKYGDTGSTICTVLARSFADIGDIIRGKDLFRGYDQKDREQKQKIQDNLKDIFAKIHEDVKRGKKQALKTRYEHDAPDFFKLREDWWEANRKEVWTAITCEAGNDSQYFRHTCGHEKNPSPTHQKCRCAANIDPPTYFDYVPQYLRWFEEWAEDFCRKRKHKLENAIKICRGENGKDKYCDRYGLDCERTKYKIGYLVEEWIAKQKKEFEKQKKKYRKEIDQKNDKTIKTRYGTINNLYADQFYTELKKNYQDVDSFLEKLNDEAICKKPPKVEDEKADHVDFKKESHTFSPTEYCDPCPDCGVKRKSDGSEKWEAKRDGTKFNGECNKVKKENNGGNVKDACDFEKTYKNSLHSLDKVCKDNRNERFKIGQKWNSKYIRKIGKDLCIPPRREHMCLDDLNILGGRTINDSTELLKKFQEAAKSEGDDIIKNLLPKNSCNADI
ncbi:pfEMP1 [Plasmodium falciparum HB3]|uniref:PfEMP1 n=1 Tax=Plasmodium falciparum (isolate HB3) TaxID=137071 RepID=A0A0L7KKA8_PLAFX|nr:pfEMP1 [Plasmodium falciparum HB3]